jgi:hypothetical protein
VRDIPFPHYVFSRKAESTYIFNALLEPLFVEPDLRNRRSSDPAGRGILSAQAREQDPLPDKEKHSLSIHH